MAVSEAHKRASMKYDKENMRQIKFNLSLKYDQDVIAQLDAVPNKQGYIKELIRADIASRGAASSEPRRISLDNGAHYLTAAEAMPEITARNLWDLVAQTMDDDTREAVHAEGPETEEQFLTIYLARAKSDLILP